MDRDQVKEIDIVSVHDSELQSAILHRGEARAQLIDVTGYRRRTDGLFDELRCSGEIRIRGVKEFTSTGTWDDEFVLGAMIDGQEISSHAQIAKAGVNARLVTFEFVLGRIAIACDGLVQFTPTGDIEIVRRGIDPFAQPTSRTPAR